jgi:protein-disulfide isomerase
MASVIGKRLQLLCVLASVTVAGVRAEGCASLSAERTEAIQQYLRSRFQLSKTADIHVVESSVVNDSCYRLIKVQSSEVKRKLTVYLSPDQRFIMSNLMDLTRDPQEDTRAKNASVRQQLLAYNSPRRGLPEAPVSLVVFSDFECPFCKRFTDLFEALPAPTKNSVQLIFKEMPLKMHPWASRAAEIATCAALQGNDAFWQMHDFLFSHQSVLTASNIDAEVEKVAGSVVNTQRLKTCLLQQEEKSTLDNDRMLAEALNVQATPTIFVNGRPLPGVRTTQDIQEAVELALQQAQPPTRAVEQHASR